MWNSHFAFRRAAPRLTGEFCRTLGWAKGELEAVNAHFGGCRLRPKGKLKAPRPTAEPKALGSQQQKRRYLGLRPRFSPRYNYIRSHSRDTKSFGSALQNRLSDKEARGHPGKIPRPSGSGNISAPRGTPRTLYIFLAAVFHLAEIYVGTPGHMSSHNRTRRLPAQNSPGA